MWPRVTLRLSVDPVHPEAEVIAQASSILASGGLVAFPTETVYGLGANALDPQAVCRIYEAKGRPARNPVIVHVAHCKDAYPLVREWPETAQILAEQFWPGPLTLVLPRSSVVPDMVTAGGPTVAIRYPLHPVAQALIRSAGVPIAAPSANRSTELSPTLPSHVLQGLEGRIDLLLDGGPTQAGIESTVVDLSGVQPRLLRPGPIPPAELERFLGPIDRQSVVSHEGPLPSPGMLAKHYSPRTPLECWSTRESLLNRIEEILRRGEKFGIVSMDDEIERLYPLKTVCMSHHPDRYAEDLYRVLHEMDDRHLQRILVQLPPESEAWLAIRDRLLRAAVSDRS